MSLCLGIDTSNYTTSVALFDGTQGKNVGKLLEVPSGALGLRQSDALFQHVKRFPALLEELYASWNIQPGDVVAVGTSTKPRWLEDSYMPCFLAGEGQGRALAQALHVPFYPCSHQQGHVAAAAWSAGHPELMDKPHLAWHLSGGTTELVLVEPVGENVSCTCIGGTSDISAGQLIDRTGLLLGLDFPAGKGLDQLAKEVTGENPFPVKIQGLNFSLSGIENQVKKRMDQGMAPEFIARYTLETIAQAVKKTTKAALKVYPGLPVLCSGGVASNQVLRAWMPQAVFAPPQYSTDNALGVAILAHRAISLTKD